MSVTTMELLLVRKSFQSVSQYRFLFEIPKSSTSGEDFVSGFSQSEEVTFSLLGFLNIRIPSPLYFTGAIYVKENNSLPEGNFYKLGLLSSIKLNYNYSDLVSDFSLVITK